MCAQTRKGLTAERHISLRRAGGQCHGVDIRSHLTPAMALKTKQGPLCACLGTVPGAGVSPVAAPYCTAFTSLSSFSPVGSTPHIQVHTDTCPILHCPVPDSRVSGSHTKPHQGPQFCGQDGYCVFIHHRAIDHFWAFLG